MVNFNVLRANGGHVGYNEVSENATPRLRRRDISVYVLVTLGILKFRFMSTREAGRNQYLSWAQSCRRVTRIHVMLGITI